MLPARRQQTIYTGGFSLAEAGISVAGRGVVMSTNHRSTRAASLWVVEFLVTMQESVTASLGRLKTGEHHPLDAGVEEFHRVLAEVATIR